jgi:L-ascorbate metabolism protein UlaG (beta-lactamase superfamily)
MKRPGCLLMGFLAAFSIGLSGCAAKYEGPVSDHFDGQVFFNPGHTKSSSVAGYLWLRLTSSQGEWPASVPLVPQPKPPALVNDGSARVTLIGHATVLIQVAGLNILTDPVWAERASPVSFAGPKRVSPAAFALVDLPKIDVVLVSHDHFDHLDTASLKALDARDQPRVIVPLGNAKLVQSAMPASEVSEHDWGATVRAESKSGGAAINIHLEPMFHGSGRSPFDQMRTLWAAFVVEAQGLKIYHVGDSGYGAGRNFKAAAAKYGSFDLAILPIGAYEPTAFMADSHMSPSEAVRAMVDANANVAMAHHHEAFQLGFEAFADSRRHLAEALTAQGIGADRFLAPQPGQFIVIRPR